MSTLAESLTSYFYLWEERGRGLYYNDTLVPLEPPFAPFYPNTSLPKKNVDDGRHATYLHFLWRSMKRTWFPQKQDVLATLALPSPKPFKDSPFFVYHISLPRSLDLNGYEAEQLLLMLSYCKYPISFEVIGSHQKIDIQITCREPDAQYVISQFKNLYPTCTILQSTDMLHHVYDTYQDTLVIEFGLQEEFMRPLSFFDAKQPSIYLGMKGVFDVLQQNEYACIQVLFQGTTHPWTASILRSVTDSEGDSFFSNAPEMPKLAQKKVASQLFGAIVRVLVSTQVPKRTDDLLNHVGNGLIGQTSSSYNSLTPLSNDGYHTDVHVEDFLLRRSRKYGMILNTEELALLVHIPDDKGVVSKLSNEHMTSKSVQLKFQGHAHMLGINEHQGGEKLVSVESEQRFTHTHVIGATGTGKSTFLLGQIAQDINNGNGVAVLDPHGDLIESILSCIPEHRLKDVILLDPSDTEYSIGFNILSANTELEKEVLSSDLVSVFQKLSTSWGDQMSSVLANTILAFLENPQGGTLLDVRRFLLEQAFREKILKAVTDPSIQYYWQKEFPILKTNSIGSILTRLDAFLRPKTIRYMVGQKDGLNFDNILNGQKILLVKLSHGLIGESNSYLLGSLIVSKIYQTALARQSNSRDSRKEFYVYIDEFQHFITPSLSHILSGGRKYNVGLILAHQSLEQISKTDSELTASIIANAGTRICFRLGESDAQKLEKGFASFTEEDLLNLGTGEAICRIGRSDMDFNLRVPKNMLTNGQVFVSPDEVIRASRVRYGVLRSELDSIIDPPTQFREEEKQIDPPKEIHVITPPITKPVVQELKPQVIEQKTVSPVLIDDPGLIADMVRRKEESRHKYLQMLIKRNAESRGYKASIEQATKDGKGRIDVVLQKGKTIIAIEVGVTTTKEWEVHNIEKCLAEDFSNIVALSEDMKGADLMTRKLTECGIFPLHADKVKVYDMTGFMGMLDKEDLAKNTKVKTIKGYRVKVEYGDKRNKDKFFI